MRESGEFKQTEQGLVLDPYAGSCFARCLRDALTRADEAKVPVTLKFNGIDLLVRPGDDPDALACRWDEAHACRAEEYHRSPEGIADALEAERYREKCQGNVDRLLASVPQQLDKLVPWLAELSGVADHAGVRFDAGQLADHLEQSGYRRGAHVTEDKEAVKRWTRRQCGEWIVGQAIDCLRRNLPPHPITRKFAEDYRRMPS